eukprot:gnl/Spiro4/16581_TR8924_c0_g1_i1.p1 gnl/Spiro4/16581_TR8924_c0_g1~~gnl/Spiro4/16581_TR8924_c0_g1_i1.p1  ORF type:complete len:278 (-),score=76.95 gnl/Spiro4/16581_TR8924_c0_g1_i1:69-902(-)
MDVSPKAALHEVLQEYCDLVKRLFESFASVPSAPRTAPAPPKPIEIVTRLLEKEQQLQRAVAELARHVERRQKLRQLAERVRARDAAMLQLILALRKIESGLAVGLAAAKKSLAAYTAATQGAVDPRDVVAFAHRLAYSTSAPPGYFISKPLVRFCPPYPEEDVIRRGVLFAPPPDAHDGGDATGDSMPPPLQGMPDEQVDLAALVPGPRSMNVVPTSFSPASFSGSEHSDSGDDDDPLLAASAPPFSRGSLSIDLNPRPPPKRPQGGLFLDLNPRG